MVDQNPTVDTRPEIGKDIHDQRNASMRWMTDNYYGEWEAVLKNYKAVADPELDQDGNEDKSLTAVGMPDTFALARRMVARVTAQIPNFRMRARDMEAAEIVSRGIMYQWDVNGTQRIQKKHVLQAVLFGWSVRAWYWAVDEFINSKRVNIMDPNLSDVTLEQVAATYEIDAKQLKADFALRAQLLAARGRGGLLPVRYLYKAYEGPKADFLFIGDCFPTPKFQNIQSSPFIVQRRRNIHWLKKLQEMNPGFKPGVLELLDKYKEGTNRYNNENKDGDALRARMERAIGKTTYDPDRETAQMHDNKEWTIWERHTPGPAPKLAYVGEDDIVIGEIEYPYDLAGKIAFTECVLIDDLLTGIGDSVPRVVRGIQKLHERNVCRRFDLIDNIVRPLVGTSNRELLENPDAVKRLGGFRFVYMRNKSDMWMHEEAAGIAAAAAALQDEQGLYRLFQIASGENNMSMAANVDPAQNRTATGAKILQAGQDILTRDVLDSYNNSSVTPDGEMMRMMNRSEAGDTLEFDAGPYRRRTPVTWREERPYAAQEDHWKQQWVQLEPQMFMQDGQMVAEPGSTLADDDETRVAIANSLWVIANERPDQFNMRKARDMVLIAHNQGQNLDQWEPEPQPPPPAIKGSAAFRIDYESLPDAVKLALLKASGVADENVQQMAESGMSLGVMGAGPSGVSEPQQPQEAEMLQ